MIENRQKFESKQQNETQGDIRPIKVRGMKPALIHHHQDRMDKPSQSWGGEGGGRDSNQAGFTGSQRLADRQQTASPALRRQVSVSEAGAFLFCSTRRWRRAAEAAPEDEPDLRFQAELELKTRTSLRIVQIVSPWKPDPGSGPKDHRWWTSSFDHIRHPLFLLSTVEKGTWALLHTQTR